MQAYMKTDMAFLGVASSERKTVRRMLASDFPPEDNQAYRDQVTDLWHQDWREAKYLAIDVARHHRRYISFTNLDLYETMIREGGWWDFVDAIAAHLVGRIVFDDRERMRPILEAWIDDDDLWIRRTALLAHLGHKEATDVAQLFDFCTRRASETEFFIRKAIGWALRQHARTDPEAVRRYVADHPELSGLSRREATKHL